MYGPIGQDEVQLGEAEAGQVRHGTDNMALRKRVAFNLIFSV